jgi:amidophosphoribosyltransferase
MKEECGIFAYFGFYQALTAIYLGLYELQHRGQESCGVATSDGNRIHCQTRMGLVLDNFQSILPALLPGLLGIGHNRYSTTGGSELKNAQPFKAVCRLGEFAVAHNGNLTNAAELRKELESKGAVFQTSSDTEVVLHLVAMSSEHSLHKAIQTALVKLRGAYSLVFLTKDSVIAARDSHGFRPLAIGQLPDGGYVFASETCAFKHCRAKYLRDVEPGELVIADKNGLEPVRFQEKGLSLQCLFELVYFSRPNSYVFDLGVYGSRKRMGRALAQSDPITGDIVVPVPNSGMQGALGYHEASNTPLEFGLTRGHYVARSFIEPTQEQRGWVVDMKLSPVPETVDGKIVMLVDDSLVRGTTATKIIATLREAGAKAVHLRLTCPRILHPCFYGVDIPDKALLVAVGRTDEEIAEIIGADTVRFLSLENLLAACGGDNFCHGCMSGSYPALVEITG